MPQTASTIMARMRSVSPSSPRLIWHGQDGRIELSGRVFDNWVAKSSNLLVDELDAGEGTVVALDLPPHWKSLALAFACWQVGCVVVLPDLPGPDGSGSGTGAAEGAARNAADTADIVLTSHAVQPVDPPRLLVCVALGSLALRWNDPLPRGAIDFAAEVRSHGDVYFGQGDDAGDRTLVRAGTEDLTAQDLAALVRLPTTTEASGSVPSSGPGSAAETPTVLLEPGTDLLRVLAAALGVWEQDGAIVLVEQGVAVTDRMLAGERVTGRLGTA